MNTVPNKIAEIRERAGLNQAELAEMIGSTQPHISKIERGSIGIPILKFAQIAKALNVEIADLFSDDRTQSEKLLIEAFRTLSKDRQMGWLDMARLVQSSTPEAAREAD